MPKEMVNNYCEAIGKIFDEIANGKKANEIATDNIPEALKPTIIKSLQQADNPYIRHFLTIDVSKQLSKIKCPVLALNGTKDIQVDCTANTTQLEKGLTACKHTIKKINGSSDKVRGIPTQIYQRYMIDFP